VKIAIRALGNEIGLSETIFSISMRLAAFLTLNMLHIFIYDIFTRLQQGCLEVLAKNIHHEVVQILGDRVCIRAGSVRLLDAVQV
jgi:hypothetical protein